VCDLGSIFRGEFLTFQPTAVPPSSDEYIMDCWLGITVSDLNPMAGMRLSMALASKPRPATKWMLGSPVRMSSGCGSPSACLLRLVVQYCSVGPLHGNKRLVLGCQCDRAAIQ